MARTEVQDANDAVLAAAEEWFQWFAGVAETAPGLQPASWLGLRDAVERRHQAVSRQDLSERSVYLRTDATESERDAARRAMISRPGWRQCIYKIIQVYTAKYGGISDQGLEDFCTGRRGAIVHMEVRAADGYRLIPILVPDRPIKHQTISSARKSLVDAGLVEWSGGYNVAAAQRGKHMIWKTTRWTP